MRISDWSSDVCSSDLWKQFAEMGFTGILIGEEQGGLGLGHVEAGVVLEEIGRNLSPSPFLATAVAAVEALKGTPHAERWFPGIIAGDAVAALAIDEGAKHRSEERRVGKEGVRTCRYRWSADNYKKKK